MSKREDWRRNEDGTIRVVDQDIIDTDRRKGEPESDEEAAHRYRLMQAEQPLRYVMPARR